MGVWMFGCGDEGGWFVGVAVGFAGACVRFAGCGW